MTSTRIVAVLILWVTAPFYSMFSYGINVMLQGGQIANHGRQYVLAGYFTAATIAAILLALVYFRWKWKNDAGFGWLVVLNILAFAAYLVLSAISDFLVVSFVPGLPITGEDGTIRFHSPQVIPIFCQVVSAGLHVLTYPLLALILAVTMGAEANLNNLVNKLKERKRVKVGGP